MGPHLVKIKEVSVPNKGAVWSKQRRSSLVAFREVPQFGYNTEENRGVVTISFLQGCKVKKFGIFSRQQRTIEGF